MRMPRSQCESYTGDSILAPVSNHLAHNRGPAAATRGRCHFTLLHERLKNVEELIIIITVGERLASTETQHAVALAPERAPPKSGGQISQDYHHVRAVWAWHEWRPFLRVNAR